MSRVKGGADLPRPPPQGHQAGRRLLRRPLDQLPHRQAGRRQGAAIRDPRPQGPQAAPSAPSGSSGSTPPSASTTPSLTYSRLIDGLAKAGIEVDRKVLADLAVHEPAAFGAIVDQAKAALA